MFITIIHGIIWSTMLQDYKIEVIVKSQLLDAL